MKQDRPLSYSALKQFDKSPNHLLAYWDRDLVPSSAMIKGRLIHTLVLEPDTFSENYAVFEGKVKRGKAYDEFALENEGKDIISEKDLDDAQAVRDAVWANPIAKDLFDITEEVEKAFEDDIMGHRMKGFIDGIGKDFIFDLKTTQSSEPRKFARDAYSYGYHLQAAIYLEATGQDDYYIISVESAAPYNVTVFKMTGDMIMRGFSELKRILADYDAWDGKPSSYSEIIEPLSLPEWAKEKETVDRF
jgi:exodeoxyribonuclease VIII